MSSVIRFLEKIGSEAQWGSATEGEMELALADAEVEGSLRSAILNKDVAQLQVLLAQKPLIGFVMPPGEEEEEEEGGEEPDENEPPADAHLSSRVPFAAQA